MVDKLVLVFDHWVGFLLSEDKNPNTKAHIKLFNDGYTQRNDGVSSSPGYILCFMDKAVYPDKLSEDLIFCEER